MAVVRPALTPQQEHDQCCTRPEGMPDEIDLRMMVPTEIGLVPLHYFNRDGDVRRCLHGIIMIGYQKYLNVNETHWRDVMMFSPTWFRVRKLV